MKLAVTGGSGVVGSAVVEAAAARGDSVLSIDRNLPEQRLDGVDYVVADLNDYDRLLELLAGREALVHMAAIPWPFRDPDQMVHNNNVVGSYNAMHAAIASGIRRICQASSVNAIGLSYSRKPRFDYFPIDEQHPNYGEDAYSLSKWICEQQADAFARRHADVSIASLRFHWVIPDRDMAAKSFNRADPATAKHLWGYSLRNPSADACLRAVEPRFTGHEVFYVTSSRTSHDTPSRELAALYFPDVPIRGAFAGNQSFFDTEKARRMLGWTQPD